MHIKKHLSQVFLKDKKYLQRIASAPVCSNDLPVLEIGSGHGELTDFLLNFCPILECIEVDSGLANSLQKKFGNNPNVKIIQADIRSFAVEKDYSSVVGNIPYHISFEIIDFLRCNRRRIQSAYLTVQKEFGYKLCAQAGTKNYGYLAAFTGAFFDKKVLFNIPKEAFKPAPKVDSCLVELKVFSALVNKIDDEAKFSDFLHKIFNLRRKKIANVLKKKFNCKTPGPILESTGIPADLRPEAINAVQYANLYKRMI